MKRSLLVRLRFNGVMYINGALLILVGVPLYQILVLGPTGFSDALNTIGTGHFSAYLHWINSYNLHFIGYRLLLLLAFALLFSLPFSLYRVIVAQELMGQQERAAAEQSEQSEQASETDEETEEQAESTPTTEPAAPISDPSTMPAHPWRGKGFAVLAAWAGIFGLGIYLLGTAISTLYFVITSSTVGSGTVPATVATFASLFAIMINTVGSGLLALSILLFGVMIVRARNLWPAIWSASGYTALAVTALFSGSAVAIANNPATGQSVLTTPATLLFSVWVLWLGIMLARLKAEA